MRLGNVRTTLAIWVTMLTTLAVGACDMLRGLRHDSKGLSSGDTVNIVEIVKGDEVLVERDGERFRVRMLGVQALDPVIADAYLEKANQAAVAFLSDLKNKPVAVFFESVINDAHGRYLAYLQAADNDLNRQMVLQGLVVTYTEFAFGREKVYLEAEATARQQHQGIWSNDKTAQLVGGLRKQWKSARHARGDSPPSDPLL